MKEGLRVKNGRRGGGEVAGKALSHLKEGDGDSLRDTMRLTCSLSKFKPPQRRFGMHIIGSPCS